MKNIEFKSKIEKFISEGLIHEAYKLLKEYNKFIEYDDEIASMEAIIEIYNSNYEKALEVVRNGLRININNSDLYFTMGNVYELKREYDRAYLCYEKSLLYNAKKENIDIISKAIENLKSNYNIKVKNYSIIILTYNQLEYTKLCLNSIRKYNGNDNCEIIIVDNNSTDGTVEWIKSQHDIKYILNKENRGFPAGCNQGIEFANKENDIFLLNNDTVILPNSIFNLRMGLYSDSNIGATGSVSNSVTYYQKIEEIYNDIKEYINYGFKNNIHCKELYEERLKLIGFAMLIKRDVLEKVGYLDERFTPGNYEDDDISIRIISEGYKLLLCKDSYIHHFGSVSFGANSEKYNNLLIKNSKKFREKWGFSSEYSLGIRNELISLMSKDFNKNINVLDIGCACGATLLQIKNKYKNANLYGIEIDEAKAKIARNVANIKTYNIEEVELDYDEEYFDYIILGDVLEHLYNPWSVIEKLKKYLKKDGQIIASIPNIMNISIIKNLLIGKWQYEDAGILDRTHIRFFTLEEIVKMFNKAGYCNIQVMSITNFENEDIDTIRQLNNIINMDLSYQYKTYQYIIKVGIS